MASAKLPIRSTMLRSLSLRGLPQTQSRTLFVARTSQSLFLREPIRSAPLPLTNDRTFTSTSALCKKQDKGGKGGKGNKKGKHDDADEGSAEESGGATVDPFDFKDLESAITTCHDKLKSQLSKLRPGGRFNPQVLEELRVAPEKSSASTVKLSEVAQVLPKGGRHVAILANEEDFLKPIVSAIQSSKELNLQPQPDGQNPLQLNLTIPPPTKESRDQAIQAVDKAADVARNVLRNARGDTHKKLQDMQKKKTARPDDVKRASALMEKLVTNATTEIKKIADAAKKTMEQ